MSKGRISFLLISLIAIFVISGCAVRTYKVTKPRVDLEVAGNKGYLAGSSAASETKPASTTRDTYVMEVEFGSSARNIDASKTKAPVQEISTTEKTALEEDFSTEEETAEEVTVAKTYKVASGDTLQKISKKFYGTYKKWQKIYNANKDKIADPNRIKPGITINIPE